MYDRLNKITERSKEIEQELSRPDAAADQNRFKQLTKEHSQLAPIVMKYGESSKLKNELSVIRILNRVFLSSDRCGISAFLSFVGVFVIFLIEPMPKLMQDCVCQYR